MQTIYKFFPKWKEELICQCADGTFILDYDMGSPTVYLPAKNKWATVAPDWSLEQWDTIYAQLTDWCSQNNVTLAIDLYAEHTLARE